MLGLLTELIINWLLLWIVYKKNLSALGILPRIKRFSNFFIGFLTSAVCCAIYYFLFNAFADNDWVSNKEFSVQTLAESSWWILKSVLFEELIFRGALLYTAIQKLGAKTACIISAVAFGIYHWFSIGSLGNTVQILSVFIMTGVWGFMFAMAFAKTRSLYLPIGIHFGWNLVSTVIFSQGPLGTQLLISSGGQKIGGILSLELFLFQVFTLPLIIFWYLKRHSQKITVLH